MTERGDRGASAGKRLQAAAAPEGAELPSGAGPLSPQGRGARRRRVGRPLAESEDAPSVPLQPRRASRGKGDAAKLCFVEVVYLYLYDIGRSVDLRKVAALIPAHTDVGIVKRRDTPASITLPKPLILQIGEQECQDLGGFDCFSAHMKIYAEGAVTVIVRVKARLPFGELHSLRDRAVIFGGEARTMAGLAELSARNLIEGIRPAVTEPRDFDVMDNETYTAFCLLDCEGNPGAFLNRNRDYVAALLIGEDPNSVLHESQITATLGKPFSYHEHDLAVFDLDRCLIIDSSADYEDLLLIIEHANYQLLELRVLDHLLDEWLDEAEDDVRMLYGPGSRRHRGRGAAAREKLAKIQALRFESLFILENLENSSKIIGDYYLGQIYGRLNSIFSTEGWKWSVERRLETLQDVYDMVKNDSGEERMVTLEIIFIVVCIIFPLVQILQVMITSSETTRAADQASALIRPLGDEGQGMSAPSELAPAGAGPADAAPDGTDAGGAPGLPGGRR
ncbi:MAG TPA: hypothetical protein VMV90_03295 [Rectinemataceae bacterium]|nr:hypothetical protein [Rectinemataceae bacterium]